jgi:hypothetical protein
VPIGNEPGAQYAEANQHLDPSFYLAMDDVTAGWQSLEINEWCA